MTLQQAQYLAAVEEWGTISKAAEECFVSQPALTKQLQLLQKEFHGELFQRKGGKMVPTDVGRVVVTCARNMLLARQWMRQSMERLQAEQKSTLKICCQKAYEDSLAFLIQSLRQKQVLSGNVRIITGGEDVARNALAEKTVDLAIFNTYPLKPEAFPYHVHHRIELFLSIAKTHPLLKRLREGESWKRVLRNETFLLHQKGLPARVFEDAYLSEQNFVPKKILIMESEGSSIGTLANGEGVGFLPYQLGNTVLHRIPLDPPFHFFTVVSWPEEPIREDARILRDLLMLEYHG